MIENLKKNALIQKLLKTQLNAPSMDLLYTIHI